MSNVDKQAVHAVADLKAGYTIGHADVAILNELARSALASLEADGEAECQHDWSFGGLNKLQSQKQCVKCGRVELVAPTAPVVPDIDTIALNTARNIMCDINRMEGWPGGDVQLLAHIQSRIEQACRAAMLQGKADGKPELTVWYGAMPETNGKINWTAILHRKGQQIWEGITIDQSEYPDRVRYEADRMRHLIGELPDEPDILSYDADAHSGYVKPGNSPVIPDGWVMVPKVPTEAMCETGHIGVDVYTGMATEGDGYYSIGGGDAARVYEFMVATAPKQENTMNDITKLSAKLVSVGMFEQLSFHDGFSLKCRELGIHASKLGHIELSKKAQDLMFSASLQQHDQLVDNMASLIELMADKYMSDKWIPVSERMPEGMKTVITSNGFDIGQGWWDGECWKSFDCHDVVPGKVTHWMPLPAAPQQEVK